MSRSLQDSVVLLIGTYDSLVVNEQIIDVFLCVTALVCSDQLSLLPSAEREMSSSLQDSVVLLIGTYDSLVVNEQIIGVFLCVTALVVGDAPKLLSGVTDVTVISPEVATLECSVKPGTKDVEIRWCELYFSSIIIACS